MPTQSSPEQSEDVAKAHNILQIHRPVFDPLDPCSVTCMHTNTNTRQFRGSHCSFQLQLRLAEQTKGRNIYVQGELR